MVRQLERAVARGDWRTVCEDVFTAAARRRAGRQATARACCARTRPGCAARASRPLAITVRKGGAEVRVRSRARGQRPLTDVIQLRRERGEYRVESLRG